MVYNGFASSIENKGNTSIYALGAGGREFESLHPDKGFKPDTIVSGFFYVIKYELAQDLIT